MRKVFFHKTEQQELYDATRWFKAHEQEVVVRIHRAVRQLMQQIAANPEQYPIISGDRRKAVLEAFPCILVFRVLDPQIQILNVFRTSRDSLEWRS